MGHPPRAPADREGRVMPTPDCSELCAAMPECTVCHLQKKPRGRDVAAAAANGYCDSDCPGYSKPPRPGHLWPSEWREHVASTRQPDTTALARCPTCWGLFPGTDGECSVCRRGPARGNKQ